METPLEAPSFPSSKKKERKLPFLDKGS